MINEFRKLLIRIGKILPFVICFLVCLNYAETAFALATNNYLDWNGVVIPNTPISFLIGQYFEYNLQMLVVLCIISIAIETCIYNKLACVYLCVNLYEKSYFANVELYTETIYIIAVTNIIVSGFFVYKGAKMLIKYK